MKIVQIMATDGGAIGGLEKHSFELAVALAQQHEVYLFADVHYASAIQALPHVKYYSFDFSKSRWNICLLFQIYSVLKQIQPDLIHAQGGKAAKILSFLLKFIPVPSVATIHGMKNNIKDYQRFNEVIAVSSKVADKVRAYRSVQTIYNGVQLRNQITQPVRSGSSPVKALAIGRLDRVKGFDQLIQAWQGIELQLDILGTGPELEHLRELISRYQLQDKIRLLGYKEDIYPDLLACDFVIVSSVKEGGPLIVAEALLVQRPVISTEVGMVRDFIPKAYIAKTNDAGALHELISFTLENFSHLQQDYQEAFQKAATQLTLAAMTQQTLAVYEKALQAARSS